MLLLIILDVVISVLDIGFLIILLFVVNFYTQSAKNIDTHSWYQNLLQQQPLLLVGSFAILFALKNWFAFLVSKKQFYFIYSIASRISHRKLSDYLDGSYLNYVNIDSSAHIRSINHDPIDFCNYVLKGMQQVISQSILIVLTIIPILFFKPVLFSLLFLLLFPPILLFVLLTRKKLQSNADAAKTIHRRVIQHLKEAISGFIESNVFQKKKFFMDRFTFFQLKQSDQLAKSQIVQTLPSRLIEVFAIFGLFILITINFFTKGKSIDLITIGAFLAAAYKIIPGIVKILNSLNQVKIYSFTVTNLLNSENISHQIANAPEESIESIQFSNVSFSYKEKTVLQNFSLSISEKDFVGISGVSGKGKTTIMNLLLGFLRPDNGVILINGEIKKEVERQAYWNKISYVQQQSFLINDSIAKNITLQENNIDKEKLEKVLAITGLQQLISSSNEGINKMITEDGKNISGGQRQRIALARALYKDAELLILDEPFNELDRKSENCILNHLKCLAQKGKMILLITHDKESLSYCNKIISLDENQ